jgi:hypothetical protein
MPNKPHAWPPGFPPMMPNINGIPIGMPSHFMNIPMPQIINPQKGVPTGIQPYIIMGDKKNFQNQNQSHSTT